MALFTPETARQAAIAGNNARWHSPKTVESEVQADAIAENIATWETEQMIRVRAQVERLLLRLSKARDAMVIDRLARAIFTLTDLARELAGKPKVKPQAAPRAERREAPKPLD